MRARKPVISLEDVLLQVKTRKLYISQRVENLKPKLKVATIVNNKIDEILNRLDEIEDIACKIAGKPLIPREKLKAPSPLFEILASSHKPGIILDDSIGSILEEDDDSIGSILEEEDAPIQFTAAQHCSEEKL